MKIIQILLVEEAGQLTIDLLGSLSHLKRLISLDPSNEELVFFVGQFTLLPSLISAANRIYSLRRKTRKYKYAEILFDAITQIALHKGVIEENVTSG